MPSLPSPVHSPSPRPAQDDDDASTSRKRARTQSLQSDDGNNNNDHTGKSTAPHSLMAQQNHIPSQPSSSPLQSIPHPPPSSDVASPGSVDSIDAYMADQGESQINDTPLPVPPPIAMRPKEPTYKNISRDEKLASIDAARMNHPLRAGETWFIVSSRWMKRFRKACTGQADKDGAVDEDDLGPADNSDIIDAQGEMIPNIIEGEQAEMVPQEVWDNFVLWYGEAKYPLPREVIERGEIKEPTIELYPLKIRVFVLDAPNETSDVRTLRPFVYASETDTLERLRHRLLDAVTHPPQREQRMWKVRTPELLNLRSERCPLQHLSGLGACPITAEYLGARLPPLATGDERTTLQEFYITSKDVFVVETKTVDGKWPLDADAVIKAFNSTSDSHDYFPGTGNLAGTQNLPPPTPPSEQTMFGSTQDFFSNLQTRLTAPAQATTGLTNQSSSSTSLGPAPPPDGMLLKPSPIISSSGSTASASRFKKEPPAPGTLGLVNLGNTCYMNSALQCLIHTNELSDYFLSGVYTDELNPDNPLGMKGAIARSFGAQMDQLWEPRSASSHNPRDFKMQLQRFAPQFSGYQQHDSQELVAFLLDGLHEDLNRVKKKPYVEKPDWEGGGDRELVELARKSWEGYMLRNDSVIVDLFQGQYQSTLTCPVCDKVSITFDPFMYLTLPLPIHKSWRHKVYYVPWDINKPHQEVAVELNGNASFKELRQLLGRWFNQNPDNLLTLEYFSSRFYKNLDDTVLCSEMAESDVIICFELPCHAQQSRTYKKSDSDPFILPLFLLQAPPALGAASSTMSTTSRYYGSGAQGRTPTAFGYPTVVVITQEQARDKEEIYRVVVSRLERWSDHARDLYDWEGFVNTAIQPDVSIPISAAAVPSDRLTEIKENGEVVTLPTLEREGGQEAEEEDITTGKGILVEDEHDPDVTMRESDRFEPIKKGPKKDVFTLKVQPNYPEFGVAKAQLPGAGRLDTFESRDEANDYEDDSENGALGNVLLRRDDALVCIFDENMRDYYFGSVATRWDHARWENWPHYEHPEYKALREEAVRQRTRGISLQDCLDEFTKEEELGEDDLWYCPRCKEHRKARKKFDLWKTPDVLVVHLKRFSSHRSLRDKIDAFVDFPIQGLDLSDIVGERKVAKSLLAKGEDIEQLHLGDLSEPLVYDLFAVDEHIGGLGGGHYRAYALNHRTQQWYHFDDSFVTPAKAEEAVNANAYLLFYRRRTDSPLGGKSHDMVQEARSKPTAVPTPPMEQSSTAVGQLPTPPDEIDEHLRRSPAPSPHEIMLDSGSLDVSDDIFRDNDPPAYCIEDLHMQGAIPMPGSLMSMPTDGYWTGSSAEGAPGLGRLTDMRDMILRDRRLDSPASSTDALPDLDDIDDDATFPSTYPDRRSGTSSSRAWTPETRPSPARSTSSARSLLTEMNVDTSMSEAAQTPFSDGEVPVAVSKKADNSGKLSEE